MQNCVWLLNYLNFESNYNIFKSKSQCILLNKNINCKNETESAWMKHETACHPVLNQKHRFGPNCGCNLCIKIWMGIIFLLSGFSFANIHDSQHSSGKCRLFVQHLSTTSSPLSSKAYIYVYYNFLYIYI